MSQVGNRTKGDTAYLYAQGATGSSAVGVDGTDSDKLKIYSSDSAGATPESGAQLEIDPSANGNVTITPNGSGGLVLTPSTPHSVLLGEGTSPIAYTNVGSNGSVLIGATGADPAFSALTSTGGTITFTPGPNSLNLEAGGTVTVQVDTDSGSATPIAGVLDVVGAHGINTSGATNVVTAAINNAITLGDLAVVTSGNSSLTLQSGDLTISGTGASAGANINIAAYTPGDGTQGVIQENGGNTLFFASDSGITYVGNAAGNTTSTAINTGIGTLALNAVTTGANNVAVGHNAGEDLTEGESNIFVGQGVCSLLTTGSKNTVIGRAIGSASTFNGSRNLIITAGNSLGQTAYTGTESNNVLIQNIGVAAESNVMRLGTHGSSSGQVNRTYIAGEVTIPNQPAFEVYLASNANNVTGTGTSYLIGSTGGATWTENFDRGSDFDNSTAAQFTAPITGLYSFTFAVRMGDITAAMASMLVTLTMTGQNHVLGPINVGAVRNGGNTYGTTGSCLTNMVAGDTATLNVAIFSGAGDTADVLGGSSANTYFSGMLVA